VGEGIAWKSECVRMEDKNASTSAMLFLCLATVLITPASAED